MAPAPTDPKSVLSALLDGAAPLPFPGPATDAARALARAPEQADPAAVEALPEPLALAVLEAAARLRSAHLPERLAASSNKAIAKAARKALYQLRSSGMALEAPLRPAEVASPAPAAEEVPPTLLSALTGNGERAMIVARPVRGGLETAHLVLSDEHGVVHLSLHEVSRGLYRKQLKEVRSGRTPRAAEIPLEEAKERLAGAAFMNERSNTPFPAGLADLMRHLDVAPRERPLAIDAPHPGDAALDPEGGSLHDQPEISEWLPDESQLRALSQTWQQLGTSPLGEGQRREPLEQAFRSAAERYFTPGIRALYAARLWEMAAFFERTGRAQVAEVARAEARLLAHAPGLPGFATQLFLKVIGLTAEALAAAPGTGGSGPTPGEKNRPDGG